MTQLRQEIAPPLHNGFAFSLVSASVASDFLRKSNFINNSSKISNDSTSSSNLSYRQSMSRGFFDNQIIHTAWSKQKYACQKSSKEAQNTIIEGYLEQGTKYLHFCSGYIGQYESAVLLTTDMEKTFHGIKE